jgi:hypothetical protein
MVVLEKESIQTLVTVHTDIMMKVSTVLIVHHVLTNVPDVLLNTSVLSVTLTELQSQIVNVKPVTPKSKEFVKNVLTNV